MAERFRRTPNAHPLHINPRIRQEVKVPLVRREGMVAINAVLH